MPVPGDAELSELRALLSRLTAAWRTGSFADLAALLREDAVFVAPGFGGRLEGRDECVDGFRQFLATARILEYRERDVAVDAWGGTAVASYAFEMVWQMAGASHRESGHDVLVLVRGDDGWRVAWRTLVPLAADPPD